MRRGIYHNVSKTPSHMYRIYKKYMKRINQFEHAIQTCPKGVFKMIFEVLFFVSQLFITLVSILVISRITQTMFKCIRSRSVSQMRYGYNKKGISK